MDFSEKYGKDIDEAVKLAAADLGLTIDEVEVTVLEQPSKGFLGIGSKLAKVRVEKKSDKKQESQSRAEKFEKKPEKKQNFSRAEKVKETKETAETKEVKEAYDIATENIPESVGDVTTGNLEKVDVMSHPAGVFITSVVKNMGLNLDITCEVGENAVKLTIEGRDSGTIIGKRGQTLDSLQYLTSLVVNKNNDRESYVKVILDAENYREKREKTLEQLAARLADKVIRTKRSVRLEPMNPYERKVIHSTLQTKPNIVTRSEGEEPYRRVVIAYK